MAKSGKTARKSTSAGGTSPPQSDLLLTLSLRRLRRKRRRPGSAADLAELMQRVSREDLHAARRRVYAKPVAAIRHFAARHGMAVTEVDTARGHVTLRAAPAVAERAFGTRIIHVTQDGRDYRYAARKPRLPRRLAGIVQAVMGLDQRPLRSRLRSHAGPDGRDGLFPSDIARLYGIGAPGRGAGQCIAIIEPSGGYNPDDLAAACRAMDLPVPHTTDIGVASGRNAPGIDLDADKEVSLDIQVAAALAPEARIVVYFTEPSEEGFARGVAQAVHDTVNRPSVVVLTWGEPEVFWPDPARKALDNTLADAVQLGITVVTAVGDDLATERMADGKAHVDYPASSPYVLGCGGTSITLDSTATAITQEVVWNDGVRGTGGGISDDYAIPAFQTAANLPTSFNGNRRGRGVPDVAAAAAEANGYRIIFRGAELVTGGTSAVAPLWGAFIALINAQRASSVGFINPTLYANRALLRPIVSGDNKVGGVGYDAGPNSGWNACAGLGVPIGPAIFAALTAVA